MQIIRLEYFQSDFRQEPLHSINITFASFGESSYNLSRFATLIQVIVKSYLRTTIHECIKVIFLKNGISIIDRTWCLCTFEKRPFDWTLSFNRTSFIS